MTIQQTVDGWIQIVKMKMPFDKRSSDPKKDYGIHSMDIFFITGKDDNYVQFFLNIPWYLDHVAHNLLTRDRLDLSFLGQGYDVGYHAKHPQYDGQSPMDCDLISTGKCYYDGSSLQAEKWYQDVLQFNNLDEIWPKLQAEWISRFGITEVTI